MILPMLRTTVVAMFLVLGWNVFAEEDSSPRENFEIGVWKVPPGFLVAASTSSSQIEALKRLPGFRSDQPAELAQYDAKDFLEQMGLVFPPGSEAIFDAASGSLIVRNTRENLELVEHLSDCPGGIPTSNIAIEVSTYQCKLPTEYSGSSASWPSYFRLIKSGVDLKLLDRVSTVTKSGVRSTLNHVVSATAATPSATPPVKADAKSFRDGEYGTIAECETVMGPDGRTIDANVNYRFRQSGTNNAPSEITINTSFTTMDGLPVILSVSPSPSEEGKFNITIANIRTSSYCDWGFEKLSSGATGKAAPKSGP